METFLIDVPIPSMGATVNELTVISLKAKAGDAVTKGQRIAELESDKSVFEFEAPCDGTLRAILVKAGDVLPAGTAFLQIETADAALRHLAHQAAQLTGEGKLGTSPESIGSPVSPVSRPLIWTPRATKLAQEAGLDPATLTGIEATGPGGRVSGDDVARFLATRKS
ncbi:biotin/lipoyl-containing protein [Horticoccus sp. 23ND18S-11]|uniref:biotin/lipoyl-containing protein n=1 Tax=Horticoccus sp. 23ND18S-11 TaxID=3391832 RepID=UPI0039C97337